MRLSQSQYFQPEANYIQLFGQNRQKQTLSCLIVIISINWVQDAPHWRDEWLCRKWVCPVVHHASNLSPSNYMGSYRVPNDFVCCLLLKKLKIKARTKWCKAHYRWQWTPGGITLNRAWFPLCSQALLWDMRTALMSAHTLDLEYAQSNFCTGGKRQLNKRTGEKIPFSSWLEREEFVYEFWHTEIVNHELKWRFVVHIIFHQGENVNESPHKRCKGVGIVKNAISLRKHFMVYWFTFKSRFKMNALWTNTRFCCMFSFYS